MRTTADPSNIGSIRVTAPTRVAKKGEFNHEYLRERIQASEWYRLDPRPTVDDIRAGTDLCDRGVPDPSLPLQPDRSVLDSRSPAPLSAISRIHSSAPTLATLRRLTIRATPLSRRDVGGRIPASGKGAPC